MKALRFVLIGMALFCVIPCFGKKRIDFRGDWIHESKSISIELPMEAFIEETEESIMIDFHKNIGKVYVTITDKYGIILFEKEVQTSDTPSLVIPYDDKNINQGMIQITDGYNKVYGYFY